MSKGAALMESEILDEIRKVRDEHAKECGYDVHRAFEQMRAEPESAVAGNENRSPRQRAR